MPDALTLTVWILAGWTALSALFWLVRGVVLEIARRRQPQLGPAVAVKLPAEPPTVTVLVAGKDEQRGIEECVRSLLDQDYPNYDIVLIDDRSGDATPQIMDRLAAQRPDKIRALHITDLPAGWCGKNNAMQQGIKLARGKWLLMIDADCKQLTRSSISLGVSRAIETGADMLSVMAAMEPDHFWDRAVQPILAGALVIWFNPGHVNDPARPTAYANGAYMMITREAYEKLGTHECVKGEVNEDIHFARLAKEKGLRLHVALNEGLYTVRMYGTLAKMIRGWSRIYYGSFKTFHKPLATLALLTFLSAQPIWAGLATAVLGAVFGFDGPVGVCLAPMVGIAWGVLLPVLMRFYHLAGVNPLYAIFYPLAVAVEYTVLFRTLNSFRSGGGITWRGTSYPTSR